MARKHPKRNPKIENWIDRRIKLVFDADAREPLSDRLRSLLDRLRANGDGRGPRDED